MWSQKLNQLIEQCPTDLRVRVLTSTKKYCQLDLVAVIKKLGGPAALGLKIVIVDLRSDPDFLQLDNVLILPGLALLAALLVPELSVIHQTAHRWNGIRRNLYEVQPLLARHFQRVPGLHDSNLVAQVIN